MSIEMKDGFVCNVQIAMTWQVANAAIAVGITRFHTASVAHSRLSYVR